MSIKANSLIGLPVITVNEGKNINTIKDIVYNGTTNLVTAFVVDEKGWFNTAKIILIQDIKSIGKDAVLVEDESKIVSANSQIDQSIAVTANNDNFLDTNEVVTRSGTKLGKVTDIYFNQITGKLEAIEVSEGFLKNIVSGTKKIAIDDIITVGTENLIVDDNAEKSIDTQAQHQGINKTVEDAKVTGVNITKQATNKIQEVTEIVKDKTSDIIHSEPIQNAFAKTQEVATNVKDKTVETYSKTKENINSGKAEAKLKDNFESVKEKVIDATEITKNVVSNTTTHAKDKIMEVSNSAAVIVQSTVDQTNDKIQEDRVKNTIGKVINNDAIIYGNSNQIIGTKGSVITPNMIKIARDDGALDRLLNSAS